ncbi:MAG: MBL fold metallo-hydrolase [Candidatus Rifleibacteriota bacterium]
MINRTARMGLLVLFFVLAGMVSWAADAPPLLRVTFLDVHQGDCTIIRTAEKTIMIDAGDDNRDAAKRYIIPYLKKEGIKHIDLAIITHPHRDHFGGFIDLLSAVTFGEFYYSCDEGVGSEETVRGGGNDAVIYKTMHDIIVQKQIPYVKAKPGDKLDFGKGIKTEVLYCQAGVKADPGTDPNKVNQNENSIIMKVTAGKISYLFTGDAEKNAENATIQAHSRKLKSNVLKSGHHGSKTSSSHAFLDMVAPEYATISAGKGNSFGHPTPEILSRYEYLKIKTFRTDEDGIIESYTDGKTIHFITNNSPIEFAQNPKVISITPNSATIQWATNREATTEIEYGATTLGESKATSHGVKVHTVTLTGLKPETTYKFKAVSRDPRETDKCIVFEGTVTTPAGTGEPLPRIEQVATNYTDIYMKHPFKVRIPVFNPGTEEAKGFTVELFHSAMDDSNLIDKVKFDSIPANNAVEAQIPAEINWIGNVELIAVLKKGSTIIDTSSINIEVKAKIFLVDCSHGNIDYYQGKFAGIKMDIYKESGFQMKSISKGITADVVKEAFVICIPHPSKDFTKEELAVLKDFSAKGGSLLLYGMADYKNLSNPDMLNDVLEVVGSKIRFNDDQVCDPTNNIGAPFRFFLSNFPNTAITGKCENKLLTRSACSLVNDKYQGLKGSANLKILAMADEDGFNVEVDNMNDGYIYASHTPVLPIPVAAAEDLGKGRVACIGDQFYLDSYYNNPSNLSTAEFNRNIAAWLGLSKEKTLKQLFMFAASLDDEKDPEIRSQRFDMVSEEILFQIRTKIDQDESEIENIKELMQEHKSESVDEINTKFKQMIDFDKLHQR